MYQKICLQIHNDYQLKGGETESAFLIANALEKSGYRVIRYYKSNEILKDINIIKRLLWGMRSLYNYKTVIDIKKIAKENAIEFALVHNTSPLVSNSIFKVLSDLCIPCYKYLQNYNIMCINGAVNKDCKCQKCADFKFTGVVSKCYKNSFLYSFIKYINLLLFNMRYKNNISGYIAISNHVKNKHIQHGISPDKIDILHHFVKQIPSHYQKTTIPKKYLYMGRLSKDKGLFTLINTFKILPGIALLIMGTGELESELKRYVSENNINNICFLGYKCGNEKLSYLQNAKALIVPSEWEEPFGRIVIEAFSLGTPVICSDLGALPELIENNITGYIFKNKDFTDLSKKILGMEKLTSHRYEDMRKECKKCYIENFTEKAYVSKLLKIIHKSR